MPELGQQLRLCGGDNRGVAVLVADEMTIHIECRLNASMSNPGGWAFEVDVLLDPGGRGRMPEGMIVVSRPNNELPLPIPLVGRLPKSSGDLKRPIFTIEHI